MAFRSRRQFVSAVILTAVMAAGSVQAAWYNPVSWFKKTPKRPELLVVTGNFVKSRILAELIQTRKGVPVLLLPTGTETNLYALGPKKEAMEVNAGDYAGFVDFMRPKQVLFLGDESYTPPEWIKQIRDDHACWVANSSDWEQVAISAERMLKIKNLAIDYLYLLHQLDENGRPIEPTVVPSKPEFENFMQGGAKPATAPAKKK